MHLKIIYSGDRAPETFSKSIFLAGPTPRSKKVESWRPEALKILENQKYDGVVFVPEFREGNMPADWDYEKQCNWEHKCLDMADMILFWVPRKLRVMPAFTTNIEFGLYANSGKVVLGTPKNWRKFPKNRYLNFIADKLAIPRFSELEDTISRALEMIGDGAQRNDAECTVPLILWRAGSFQSWYCAKRDAGHKLKNSRLDFLIRKGKKRDWIYAWGLWVDIEVQGENRRKYNEHVISRPDISSILMYEENPDVLDTKIVLVREFRSQANTADGFIWELPGGSSYNPDKLPEETASEEVEEETGLILVPSKLIRHESRQLAGTFSAHKAHLFSLLLCEPQIKWLEAQKNIPHGADFEETGERTFVEIKTLKEILKDELLDWSDIGMILSVLTK